MSATWRLVLIVSIVLNIFLAGAIAGGIYRWTHYGPPLQRAGWRLRAAQVLPPPQRQAFRQTVRATMRDAAPLVAEAQASRREAARLFVAPTFDAPAVLAQLDRARVADGALRARLERQVVAFAAALPLDQRDAFADALRRGPLRQPVPKRARPSDGSAPPAR